MTWKEEQGWMGRQQSTPDQRAGRQRADFDNKLGNFHSHHYGPGSPAGHRTQNGPH